MSVFVNILGNAPGYDNDAQRVVRSHVMKDFRQRQREAERQRCKTTSRVEAKPSRDVSKRQPGGHADHGDPGKRDRRDELSDAVKPPEGIVEVQETTAACTKQITMPRFIPISSRSFNGRQNPGCKDNLSTREYHSQAPVTLAQDYKTYVATSIGSTVRSPEAYRQQLMLPFIDLHYSDAMPNLHLAFPKIHARLKPLRTGIKTAATDAVLLQALAISSKDESLMWAARRRNNEAIGGLRHLLSMSKNCESDEMLLTTDALAFFDAGSATWRKHASGLSALIVARGPNIYDTFAFLLHALVLQLLGDALLWRKPFVFGEPRWLRSMLPTCQTRMNRLVYLGCRVPDLMNRTDVYLSQPEKPIFNLESLLDLINGLEHSLQEWLSDWYLDEFYNVPPYTITSDTERLDLGLPISLDPAPLCASYTFPSLREAFGHNCFWTLLLLVRQAQYRLLASSSTTNNVMAAASQRTACEAADSICRAASFILQRVSGLPGGLACSAGPLIIAGRWYKLCGKSELAAWCFATADALTANMSQPPGWITRSCAAWITAAL